MKKALFNHIVALFLALGLCLSGCSDQSKQVESTEIEDPAAVYQTALNALRSKDDYTADMLHSRRVQVGEQSFREAKRQQLYICQKSADDSRITVQQDLFFGDQSISAQLLYSDGMAYLELGGTMFSQETTLLEFYKEHIGVIPPETCWFSRINGVINNDYTVITFRDPTDLQAWSLPENATFADASSTVTLDSKGNLVFLCNEIQYACGGNTVTELYGISYRESEATPSFDIPSNTVTVDSLQYPLLLERCSGYLQQADYVSCESDKKLSSQVTGIHLTESVNMTKDRYGEALDATVHTIVTAEDPTKGSEVSQQVQTEQFSNGRYLVSSNGGEPAENTAVTTDGFEKYCNNLLLESILLPQYITNITVEQSEGSVKIHFQADERLAQIMSTEACSRLYQEPELINSLTQNCSYETISAYLTIDPNTNLPIASGLQFEGVHVLDNASYAITSQIDQLYSFS